MAKSTRYSICAIHLSASDTALIDNVLLVLEHAGFQIERVDRDAGVIDCTGETAVVRGMKRVRLFERIVELDHFSGWFPPRAGAG